MIGPDESWGARKQDSAHVTTLKNSFLESCTVNKNVVVVLDCAAVRRKCSPEIAALISTLMRNRLQGLTKDDSFAEVEFDDFAKTSVQFLELCPLMAVTGDHTRSAILSLSGSHPHLDLFKRTSAKVLIVDTEKYPKDVEMLHFLGNVDNVRAGTQKKMGFGDLVLQLRRTLEARNQLGDNVDWKVIQEIKELRSVSWGMPGPSVGQIYQIAKVANPTEWALHERLLTGNVQPMRGSKATRMKGGKQIGANVASSAQYSTGLGGLAEEDRIRVLSEVVDGIRDCAGCNNECHRLKARNYVREEILKLANFVRMGRKKEQRAPFATWMDLQEDVPLCAEPTFVDGWILWAMNNKKKKDGSKKRDLGSQEEFKNRVTELVTSRLLTQVGTSIYDIFNSFL